MKNKFFKMLPFYFFIPIFLNSCKISSSTPTITPTINLVGDWILIGTYGSGGTNIIKVPNSASYTIQLTDSGTMIANRKNPSCFIGHWSLNKDGSYNFKMICKEGIDSVQNSIFNGYVKDSLLYFGYLPVFETTGYQVFTKLRK